MPARRPGESRLYEALLRLTLPRRLVERYGGEMQHTFALLRREAWEGGGPIAVTAAWWRELRQLGVARRGVHRLDPRGSGERPPMRRGRSEGGGRSERGGLPAIAVHCIAQALRGLRRSPGLAATVMLTLGLGIGANAAVFSIVNSVLLNPLPYEKGDRIFRIWQSLPDRGFSIGLPYERAIELRERSQTLERIEIFDSGDGLLGRGDQAVEVRVGLATPGLFDALGLKPRLGRGFVAADTEPGAEDVVLLGEDLWQRDFGASTDIVGRVLSVDGRPRVVVGVVDASIRYLGAGIDLWVPMAEAPAGTSWLTILAWRREDVSVEQARAEMEVLAFDDERYGTTLARLVLPEDLVSDETQALLYGTLAAVSLVLLIACVNVAHLMLARGSVRRTEIAVRTALGAGRRRIAGELLVESGLLALAGGASGLLFAHWSIDLLASLRPDSLPIALDNIRVDGTVMAYAAGLSMFAAVIAGIAPISDLWRLQPADAMRRGGSAAVAGSVGRLARRGLLVAEVALSIMLLVGAGLLLHSLARLQRADPGYDVRGLTSVPVSVDVGARPGARQLAELHDEMLEVAKGAGVEAAALASNAPVHDMMFSGTLELEATGEVHERVRASLTWAAPGYFAALGIPIVEGRDFDAANADTGETEVIVNRTFAERYFAGTSAVGKAFRRQRQSDAVYRIVGVVGNAVQLDPLEREYDLQMYWPLWTLNLRPVGPGGSIRPLGLSLLVRFPAGPTGSLELLVERLRPLGAEVDVGRMDSIRDRLSAALDGPRFNAILFGAFAALAIGLASLGLYGVVSHLVERRTREMGIRLAVGARAADVRRLVLRQGMGPVVVGVIIGLAAAAGAGRVISGLLYLVEPLDPLVFLLVPALVALVAVAAMWLPALRATRVDPVVILRAE